MRDRLGQPAAAAACTEGRAMSLEDAVTYALGDGVDGEGPLV
jgi:hypothetical protein